MTVIDGTKLALIVNALREKAAGDREAIAESLGASLPARAVQHVDAARFLAQTLERQTLERQTLEAEALADEIENAGYLEVQP